MHQMIHENQYFGKLWQVFFVQPPHDVQPPMMSNLKDYQIFNFQDFLGYFQVHDDESRLGMRSGAVDSWWPPFSLGKNLIWVCLLINFSVDFVSSAGLSSVYC
ncbi:hypothetical protein OXYTRIMIC_334 [Oxytricha trifallax]|uniref:Uncharacterized protein n=1 Tax=Oxytricha trifallax TaxID=1172189 RepID=A0A073HXZ4_9SPIT|nr:hypothetical protein OXYTRIMIC_334 [Oxytricha trifallax]